jgi:hypothetical protein
MGARWLMIQTVMGWLTTGNTQTFATAALFVLLALINNLEAAKTDVRLQTLCRPFEVRSSAAYA